MERALGPSHSAPADNATSDSDHAGPSSGTSQPIGAKKPQAPSADHATILLDLMAYQRTFDGAYMRTALNELSYALVVLRLFQSTFYYIGLVSVLLALGLAVAGVQRSSLGRENVRRMAHGTPSDRSSPERRGASSWWHSGAQDGQSPLAKVASIFKRPSESRLIAEDAEIGMSADEEDEESVLHGVSHFKTAGNVVALTTIGTLSVQIAILCIILTM